MSNDGRRRRHRLKSPTLSEVRARPKADVGAMAAPTELPVTGLRASAVATERAFGCHGEFTRGAAPSVIFSYILRSVSL